MRDHLLVDPQPIVAFDPVGKDTEEKMSQIEISGVTLSMLNKNSQMGPGSSFSMTPYEEFLSNSTSLDFTDFGYVLNNYGHRCDNFKKEEGSDNHFLFAGCSFTFGEGLPYQQNWSGIIHQKIKSKNKVDSGYYSLGYCGGGVDLICKNIVSYVNAFGFPKCVFVLFPDSSRFSKVIDEKDISIVPFKDEDKLKIWESEEKSFLKSYKLIQKLAHFLEKNGVAIYWSTWEESDRKLFKKYPKINGYVPLSEFSIFEYAEDKTKETAKYYQIARDMSHPGVRYNSGVANIFWRDYEKTH